MKKILLLPLMLVAVISLAACGENLDALELLEQSREAGIDFDSMEIEVDALIRMSESEGDFTMDTLMRMRLEVESEERMRRDMDLIISDSERHTLMFLRDGYEYTEMDDQHLRVDLESYDSVIVDEMTAMLGDDLTFIDEEWIETSTAERTDDDGYLLEFTLNAEGLAAFLEDGESWLPGMHNIGDLSAVDEEETEYWIMDVVIELNEDYDLTSFAVTIEFKVEEAFTDDSGQEVDMEIEVTMEVLFEDVVIDFPNWVDELGIVIPIFDTDLVGVWEWERPGSEYLLIFDSNRTGLLLDNTEGNMVFEHFTWRILNENHVYIDFDANTEPDRRLAVRDRYVLSLASLDGGHDMVLHFSMTIEEFLELLELLENGNNAVDNGASEPDEDENDEDDASADGVHDIVGTWRWNFSDEFQLVFNADGTGEWIGFYDDFTWEISGDELTINIFRVPQRWSFEISGNNLIISSLDAEGITYTYIRQ